MSEERNTAQGILERYNRLLGESVENPAIYTVTTGGSPNEGTEAPGDYWQREVERTLRVFRLTGHILGSIMQHHEFEIPNSRPGAEHSDNFMRLLLWEGRQVILSMVDMRDDFNYHVVHVTRYPLQQPIVGLLAPLIEADQHYRAEHPDAADF